MRRDGARLPLLARSAPQGEGQAHVRALQHLPREGARPSLHARRQRQVAARHLDHHRARLRPRLRLPPGQGARALRLRADGSDLREVLPQAGQDKVGVGGFSDRGGDAGGQAAARRRPERKDAGPGPLGRPRRQERGPQELRQVGERDARSSPPRRGSSPPSALCLRSATPAWESSRRTTARSRLASSGAGRSWARPRRTRASGSSASIRSPKIWPRSLWRPSTSTSGESPCLLRSCG
mgnify:CR=1 FL=1